MPRFFVREVSGQTARVEGEDAKHITKALRMREGERLTLCDGRGTDYLCEIVELGQSVIARVLAFSPSKAEPSVRAVVFQALPKADKMDFIVQKCVELGAFSVVPVLTGRCVSRPDPRALEAKTVRWNRIALEAAKQSGRGVVPRVQPAVAFEEALRQLSRMERAVLFYERGGVPFLEAVAGVAAEAGFLIGPEGGFEEAEVEIARRAGVFIAGLGPRILRTETAPLCVLSALMATTGNL